MPGWVYVMSNPAMPGLVKVGQTANHPTERARQLENTGVPHRYIVEYHAEVDHPYALEQRVHASLKNFHDGKEWFRCSIEIAIATIRDGAHGKIYKEYSRKIDEQKVAQEKARIEKQRKIADIEERYSKDITEAEGKFSWLRFSCAFAVLCFVISSISHKLPAVTVALFALLGTFFLSFMFHGLFTTKDKAKYNDLINRRDNEISELRNSVFSNSVSSQARIYTCFNCGQKLRVSSNQQVKATCPKCGRTYTYP